MHTSPAYAEDVYIGCALRHRSRRSSRDLRGGRERPRRHRPLPQGLGAPPEPVPGAAEQPLRRARRADVARRRAGAVGARLPHRAVAGADRLLALLAPALLLAGQGRVHAGAGAGLRRRDGPQGARADDRVPDRPRHRRADGAELPDRGRARPRARRGRQLHPRPRPRRRGQHRHAEGAAAHGRDPADPARLVARRRAVRQGPGGARDRRPGSRNRSAAAATRRCSARRCCSSPPTTSPRRWTAASRRSSCTPTAAWWPGARGCAAPSAATTSSPTACCAR